MIRDRPTKTVDTCIEFDGMYVAVETRIPEAAAFVRSMYQYMSSLGGKRIVGRILIERTGSDYSISTTGAERLTVSELPALYPQIVDDVLAFFIRANPGFCWLHAAAVAADNAALLIPGASGDGKSTFSTLLAENGWRFMSDDVAPINRERNSVLAFPQRPQRRRFSEGIAGMPGLGRLEREFVALTPEQVSHDEAVVRFLVFPVFVAGERGSLVPIPPGNAALEILRNLRNFSDHNNLAIEAAVSLGKQAAAYRLQYRNPAEGLEVLVAALG